MHVLVTGGAGFIGSHVADQLIARGDRVTILDDLSTGKRTNLPPDATFLELDLREADLDAVFAEGRFDAVVHLAAQMSVQVSVKRPAVDADINIVGLLNLMEAARAHGVRRIVFSSTGGAAYDDAAPFPTPESYPARPLAPYGVAKISCELYLNYYHKVHHLPYAALRFGNVFGPRQNPDGEAGVVAIFAKKLLAGEAPTIHGDGEQTRDYVYVGDVARSVLLALDSDVVDVFNVGTGVETSVNRIADSLVRAMNTDLRPVHGPGKPGEVRRSSLAIDRIRGALGWEPLVSLDEGIRDTVDFFRRQKENPEAR